MRRLFLVHDAGFLLVGYNFCNKISRGTGLRIILLLQLGLLLTLPIQNY